MMQDDGELMLEDEEKWSRVEDEAFLWRILENSEQFYFKGPSGL